MLLLLAAAAGVGITATGGDMLGSRWQKKELHESMEELADAEEKVRPCPPCLP